MIANNYAWPGIGTILYNVELDSIFKDDLTFVDGFENIGFIYIKSKITGDIRVIHASCNSFITLYYNDEEDEETTTPSPDESTETSSTPPPDVNITPIEYLVNNTNLESGYYLFQLEHSTYVTSIICLYDKEHHNITSTLTLSNGNVAYVGDFVYGSIYVCQNGRMIEGNIESIRQDSLPSQYSQEAPSNWNNSITMTGSSGDLHAGTYYRTPEMAWQKLIDPNVNKNSDQIDKGYGFKLTYHPFPVNSSQQDALINELKNLQSQISNLSSNDNITQEEDEELNKLRQEYEDKKSNLDDLIRNGGNYFYYRFVAKQYEGDYEFFWLKHPIHRWEIPDSNNIKFCGTYGIKSTKIYPFLVAITGLPRSTWYTVISFKKINGNITLFNHQQVKTFANRTQSIKITYDTEAENILDDKEKDCINTVIDILNSTVVSNITVNIKYSPNDFTYSQTEDIYDIYMDRGERGYGRRGYIMWMMSKILMNRDFSDPDQITKYMEWATNTENAIWVRDNDLNDYSSFKHLYPIDSHGVYRYNDLADLYRTAVAIQVSLGQSS